MASHRRAKEPGPGRILALTAAAAAAVTLTAHGSAFAAPAPAAPRGSSAQDVEDKVGALYNQAESAGQRYDAALAEQQELQRRADALQQRIADEQQRLNDAVDSIAAVAGAEYRQGDLPQTLQLLLDARPEQYLDRAAAADQVDLWAAQEVQQIRAEESQLAQDRTQAVGELRQLAQLRSSLLGAKAQAQSRLAAARALFSTLSTVQQAALQQAQQQSAQAALAAVQSGQQLLGAAQAPADARAALAVAAAESALGMPYLYGATGPGAFDCSGLMYWAWQHAGVTLPRTSQGQAFAGTRIPLSQARPGDLVIYYGDMHHVGMYVGNDMIIHAPYPGATVRYERATDMPVAAVVRV
jgi:cell wall-associated NlpC family hydrolase